LMQPAPALRITATTVMDPIFMRSAPEQAACLPAAGESCSSRLVQ
jgi:hypothetical protein